MIPEPPVELPPPAAVSASGAPPALPLRRWLLYSFILAAIAALPYLNSLRNGFVYDDSDQILVNPYIKDFHHLREIFTSSVWSFMGDFRGSTNYYRPMMSVGYLLCYQIFGPNAHGFHLANLLANIGVVLLVFLLTLKMFRSAAVAFAAACIFALHPIHSEAVDWIAAVTELELALFYLLTFWFFLSSARPLGKTSVAYQIGVGGTFALAMLSKEQALTLPLLATLYEHFFREDRGQTSRGQKVRRYAVLWLLVIIYLATRSKYLGGFAPSTNRANFGMDDVVVSALALIARYCWKLIWPFPFCAYYVFPVDVTVLYPTAVGGVAALALGVWGVVALRKVNQQAAFGVVWFVVILTPVLNVVWMPTNAFAERYLYLASVGICWIVAWAGMKAWNHLAARRSAWRAVLPIAASLIAGVWAFRIVVRNRDWYDDRSFYTAILKVSPNADYIHNNLGTVYWAENNFPAAEREWRTALKLAPRSEYALHNLGLVEIEQKQYPEAEALFLRALAIRPNYSDAHLDLGKTYEAMGRLDDAESQLRTAETLSPLKVRAHLALSEFYLDQRQLAKAQQEAQRSVEIQPTPQGYWDLGLAEWLKGNRPDAERALLAAARISPFDSRSHFMLGLFYMDSKRTAEAIREYQAGLRLEPTNAEAQANLKKLESAGGQKP